MRRRVFPLLVLLCAGALVACGSKGIDLDSNASADDERGAQLFAERCAGCHTLGAAGAEGSAVDPNTAERLDGPNFDERVETPERVLYAIRNGGYSGALMPQNIVVGEDAKKVAAFVAKYAGRDRSSPKSPQDGVKQDSEGEEQQEAGEVTTPEASTTPSPPSEDTQSGTEAE